MAKRRRNKNKVPKTDSLIIDEIVGKPQKVESATQTYIEDTFDIDKNIQTEPEIISNTIKKKTKIIKTEEELKASFAYKNKLNKIKVKIEHEKSFLFLFDYVESTKKYRTFYINDTDDEYDLLLLDIVVLFKKKLSTKQISYEVYNKFEVYFDNLKFLYGRFKRADNTEKHGLNKELQQMKDISPEISYYYFS